MCACLLSSLSRFCFSFLFLFSCGWNIQKKLKNENTKNIYLPLMPKKFFPIREVIGRLCVEEMRVDLEHLCSCSWKQCKKIHGIFSENNYPLVYIHCIIKIMCQALVLGWLDCLFTMCRTKTETLAVAHDFTFFYWKVKCVWNFLHITSVQIFQILKFIS